MYRRCRRGENIHYHICLSALLRKLEFGGLNGTMPDNTVGRGIAPAEMYRIRCVFVEWESFKAGIKRLVEWNMPDVCVGNGFIRSEKSVNIHGSLDGNGS